MEKLTIENLTKSYGAVQALKQVSFEVQKGRVVGLLGPNGAGKTTLIRILNQIIKPDEGKIKVDGSLAHASLNERIGYLPEERGLYKNEKVLNQLVYFGRLKGMAQSAAKEEAMGWLDKFEIADWSNKKVEALSKGMAQKIQFIATILHDPEIIILDEPFSGFDPVNVELITKYLMELKDKGKLIMISTHNMNSAEQLCDDIVLINKGEKVLSGSIQQLRQEFADEVHSISFEGNMLAFANALWTGYELIDKVSHSDNLHTAYLKMKYDNDLTALVKTMEGQVKVTSVQQYFPTMHEVFIKAVTPKAEEA